MTKQKQWISVEDAIPRFNQMCLVYGKYGIRINRFKGFWESEYPVKEDEITHWMPLPEIPDDILNSLKEE